MADLKTAGVQLVVEGLSKFTSDMGKANSAVQLLRPPQTLLQKGFAALTDKVIGFGESIIRVAEVALGVLLRDAIRAAIDFINELAQATIEAGKEFQTLEIRLGRLNFNDAFESTKDFDTAMADATKTTQDQLQWLLKLAATSPYDATDVANTFTLARSYGFAGDMAKGLTQDILDFTSGMGLSNVEMKRVILNFGQMQQQGKVTQREMNDLARGAFVPVNDILKVMSEQTGVAMEDMDDFRKTAESVPAFMEAFSTLVETRFAGATEQMSQTFGAATDNIKDLVKGILGLNTVKPILDVLGTRAAAFADSFTQDPERWDRLVKAVGRLGEALSAIVEDIFGLLPSTEDLADNVVTVVENIATWVEDNRENIVGFFMELGETIRNDIVPWVRDELLPAMEEFFTWVIENKDLFLELFTTLGEVLVNDILPVLVNDVLPAIQDLIKWITENKEEIKGWIDFIVKAFIVWQILSTVLNIVIGVIISIVGFVLGFISVLGILISIVVFLTNPIAALIVALVGLGLMFVFWGDRIKMGWENLWKTVKLVTKILFNATVTFIKNKIQEIKEKVTSLKWFSIGEKITSGIADGIRNGASAIINAAKGAAISAYNAALSFLGIRSPSRLFMGVGENMMKGMALGIENAANIASGSMRGAVAQVTAQAAPSVTNMTNNTVTNNFGLQITSNAQQEPLIQDFNMLQSLAGA